MTRILILITLVCLSRTAEGQLLTATSTAGYPGTSVWFNVELDPKGKNITATKNDIAFDAANIPVAHCEKNASLPKDLSWQSQGSSAVRALILATTELTLAPILQKTVLYRCRVDIPANATTGWYPLTLTNVSASDALGNAKTLTVQSGTIAVVQCCGC